MKKLIVLALICFGAISCAEKKVEEEKIDKSKTLVALKKLPKSNEPNEKASLILHDWTEYNAFHSAFRSIYNVDNREDLTIALEGLIEKQKLLEASTYPEEFDRPDIKSRLRTVRTYVLKTKLDMEFDINPRESVIQMVTAYNALSNQFSIVVKSTLDPKVLFDE
ncbi:hypothetical protein H0I23_15760 [Cellulophaga sp. HaHaR_3_176]|uniref:hypothetical protein n=1 Tax=Cellulophaga sp. HaHaR_3_176 TaxID=1942464 RepID=UPI001C1FC757|nr:hypothetical protein [Cellulophaga sp. HaHaR_3_176]QWX83885.1 hypothetical protein H0I23_15760 [Cellulophaga sp. HaHaR_3_176]